MCQEASLPDPADKRRGMVRIPGGIATIGSERYHPEERPKRRAEVDGFWMDPFEVTNAQFSVFVEATGYVTLAERVQAGGAVFSMPGEGEGAGGPVGRWRLDPEATWRRPHGSGSSIDALAHHPVVQVVYEDALAYARWLGRDLPTEVEWEHAARGGLRDKEFTWGNDASPPGPPRANHWQGNFPLFDLATDDYSGTAPVGCFPANGYGLYDMAGNVWELVSDPWPEEAGSHVIKGGSYLCADDYCLRYRPAARQPADDSMGTSHTGFRTVLRPPEPS